MSSIVPDDILALKDSPKAHQLLNHLQSLGVHNAEIVIETHIERSWVFLSVNVPQQIVYPPNYPPSSTYTYMKPLFQTSIQFIEDQVAFIHSTYCLDGFQGKGIFGLIDDLRDRIIEKLCVRFVTSMVRNDNVHMQQAALKAGWKKSFVGTLHSIFVKEVQHA